MEDIYYRNIATGKMVTEFDYINLSQLPYWMLPYDKRVKLNEHGISFKEYGQLNPVSGYIKITKEEFMEEMGIQWEKYLIYLKSFIKNNSARPYFPEYAPSPYAFWDWYNKEE